MINNELQVPVTIADTNTDDGDVQMSSNSLNTSSVLANPAWILGTCMHALHKRTHSEWTTKVDICDWIRSGTKNWGSAPEVLAGLTPLARIRYVYHC